MKTESLLIAAMLAFTPSAHAATLADKLREYIGKPATIANGRNTLDAKITSVESDHFCAEVRPPGFTHERCYAIAAISFIC